MDMFTRAMIVVCLLAAAACGGGGASASSGGGRAPGIQPAVASALAAQADAVAADIDAGNGCKARNEALQLQSAVDLAIGAGQVPARLQEPLRTAVASLGSRVVCTPPKPRHGPHHKPHGHDKQGDQGNGGDGGD